MPTNYPGKNNKQDICRSKILSGRTTKRDIVDDLLCLLDKEENIKDFVAYADDLCIFISDNSGNRELKIKVNIAVRTIYN
jgi:hypothetical protein